MIRLKRNWPYIFGLLLSVGTTTTVALAGDQIVLETVSDYTFVDPSGGSDTDANTEGAGFWNAMTASGTGWSTGSWYTDNNVYDTDFYDPDRTGGASDQDIFFDRSTAGISFVIAHGDCDDVTNLDCTQDSQCGQGYCPHFPLAAGQKAACILNERRTILTSSSNSSHSNKVIYGANPGSWSWNVALGESSNSGSWSGAGTNGGTNIGIITNSCGFRKRYLAPTNYHANGFFAGVHMLMVHAPVGNIYNSTGVNSAYADTAQWSARGSTMAGLILTNMNAPAKDAWLTPAMANSSFTGGAGANIVMSFDSDSNTAKSRLDNETWTQSQSDSLDATSGGGGYLYWACNFSNCSSYNL